MDTVRPSHPPRQAASAITDSSDAPVWFGGAVDSDESDNSTEAG
jgi:hypothetical protein